MKIMDIKEVKRATKSYPRFADGRIDYSNERICFVLNCVVMCGNKILLTKRSADVVAYPNTINGISGFIDRTDMSIEDLAKNELIEELDAPTETIDNLAVGVPFVQVDNSINREWRVTAVLVEFSQPFEPKVNWENKSARWYELDKVSDMVLMRGFPETLEKALKLRDAFA